MSSVLCFLLFSHSAVSDSLWPPWTAHQASLSFTNSQSLLKLMSMESVIPSNHLILCHPLLLLPSVFPCIRVFSNESAFHIRWPKYWSFSFSISPSNEYSGLISFRMDWLDLLAVQGTLKSLPQHHSSKASILLHWDFFMVQCSHLYITTRKTIALTIRTFVGKEMSLLFNMLSWFVISCKSWAKSWVTEWARLCHCPSRTNSLKTEEPMMIYHLEIHSMIRYIYQEMSFLNNMASFPIMLMVITIYRRTKNFRLMDICRKIQCTDDS